MDFRAISALRRPPACSVSDGVGEVRDKFDIAHVADIRAIRNRFSDGPVDVFGMCDVAHFEYRPEISTSAPKAPPRSLFGGSPAFDFRWFRGLFGKFSCAHVEDRP